MSSDGLATVDPWLYRQGFNVDSWLLPDTFSHDNDLLARALHTTVTSTTHSLSPSDFFDSSAVSHLSSTHTLSSTGSEPEIVGGGGGPKRKRNCLLTVSNSDNKPTKRRSRAISKKSQTTFITADPENFRQMVQQVTGANYIDDSSFAPIFKPEPNRLVNRLPPCDDHRSTAVPTLDTSAFLSNHQQENAFSGGLPTAKASATVDVSGSAVDIYPNFPTLESWTVM